MQSRMTQVVNSSHQAARRRILSTSAQCLRYTRNDVMFENARRRRPLFHRRADPASRRFYSTLYYSSPPIPHPHFSRGRSLSSVQPGTRSETFSSEAAVASQYDDYDEEEEKTEVYRFAKSNLADIWDEEASLFQDDEIWDEGTLPLLDEDPSLAEGTSLEKDTSLAEEVVESESEESPPEEVSPSWPSQISPHQPPSISTLLSTFDPANPPSPSSPLSLQLWFECESQRESVNKYSTAIASARERQDYASLTPVQEQLRQWYQPLKDAIEAEQKAFFTNARGKKDRSNYGPYLCTLQAEKLAVITAHEATIHALNSSGGSGATLASTAVQIGDAVEAEVNVQKVLWSLIREKQPDNDDDDNDNDNDNDIKTLSSNNKKPSLNNKAQSKNWMYTPTHLNRFVAEANKSDFGNKKRLRVARAHRRARQLLNDSQEEWPTYVKAKLGVALISLLLETAEFRGQPAFKYEKRWIAWNKLVGHLSIQSGFYEMVIEDKYNSLAPHSTRHKPMIVKPTDWVSPQEGGYYALKCGLMRTHGCKIQKAALQSTSHLETVFDGLNVLGKIPWKINQRILDVANQCWDDGIILGDIPSRTDYQVPPAPPKPDISPSQKNELFKNKDSPEFQQSVQDYRDYREKMTKHRRMYQRNMDLRSLRCSTLLKLNQAMKFKEFDEIYFPYNLDFRGRAYPVPPHLSNVGSDLCRGLLVFSEKKPLGEKGMYWLKVHLANLAGKDKVSFDERKKFTEEHMEYVVASAKHPMEEDEYSSWWRHAEDPFQALATCMEIVNAMESGDPASYECALAVHMDGSCNGLQHYAALGRDRVGGKAVNLLSCDTPQDVYSGVMNEVISRVKEEAKKDVKEEGELSKKEKEAARNNRAAKLVNGLIDRGVVKRTVMTSVYGVTFIGARKQIQEKIEEKLEEKGHDIDEIEHNIHEASGYLAKITMDVMGELFTGARQTMNWLTTCARLITTHGHPVAWISPIGVPVVQPYRQNKSYIITTLLQSMVLSKDSDNLPIHKHRQVSAFPPNYVHSLDSSHMLFTALEMDKRGLAFSAVHDSFWTHPCDVDEMNEVLRETFVDLYDRPLLEELKRTWELRYPDITFPEVPERGDLDLNEVRKATYFFQ